MIFQYFSDIFTGIILGSSIFTLGYILDHTISKKDYLSLTSTEDGCKKYDISQRAIRTNLLLLTPIIYPISCKTVIMHDHKCFNTFACIVFILVHNFGYFVMHRTMHVYPSMYKYHKFHHMFDNILLPSIGNATSKEEFLLAYVVPTFVAGKMVTINEASFIMSLFIISLFNLFIHCGPLQYVDWVPGFITPQHHHLHHKKKSKHYSAPLINYDPLFEKKMSK